MSYVSPPHTRWRVTAWYRNGDRRKRRYQTITEAYRAYDDQVANKDTVKVVLHEVEVHANYELLRQWEAE